MDKKEVLRRMGHHHHWTLLSTWLVQIVVDPNHHNCRQHRPSLRLPTITTIVVLCQHYRRCQQPHHCLENNVFTVIINPRKCCHCHHYLSLHEHHHVRAVATTIISCFHLSNNGSAWPWPTCFGFTPTCTTL